jgi:hypothetical protein
MTESEYDPGRNLGAMVGKARLRVGLSGVFGDVRGDLAREPRARHLARRVQLCPGRSVSETVSGDTNLRRGGLWAAAVNIALWDAFFRAVQAGQFEDEEERVAAVPAAAPESAVPNTPTAIVRPSADGSDGPDGARRPGLVVAAE